MGRSRENEIKSFIIEWIGEGLLEVHDDQALLLIIHVGRVEIPSTEGRVFDLKIDGVSHKVAVSVAEVREVVPGLKVQNGGA